MIKTINIAVKNIDHVNNYYRLPLNSRLLLGNTEIRVIIHRDPDYFFSGSQDSSSNFDILLDFSPSPDLFMKRMPKHYLHVPRFPKTEQLGIYNSVIAEDRAGEGVLDQFEPVKIFGRPRISAGSRSSSEWKDFRLGDLKNFYKGETKFVLKISDGAKGIGQVLFDITKVSPNSLISTIGITEKLEDLAKTDLATIKHDPSYSNNIFKMYDFFLSPYIEVEDEWRVLISAKKEISILRRSREETGSDTFVQANLSSGGFKSLSEEDSSMDHLKPKLRRLAEKMDIIGSLDLYKNKATGQYGIFEYCNQFGYETVPYEILEKFNQDMIAFLVERFTTE